MNGPQQDDWRGKFLDRWSQLGPHKRNMVAGFVTAIDDLNCGRLGPTDSLAVYEFLNDMRPLDDVAAWLIDHAYLNADLSRGPRLRDS